MKKSAIKTIYAGIGLSALSLVGVKQPVVLGALVLGVSLFLGAIIFVVWMVEDYKD
ncbi:hypothetical protein P0D88_52025 [Paraburkholderia sp. RL18-103-BIB-C]|uniref:hypothetical protein n=1 Tax=unclassified Paraburkholderia TaxID=2615204 RepID=UPI0038BD805E